MQPAIHLKGVKVHNLKNVSLSIPSCALVVFTGVSGSGKSSLAFDTIYAEGQRRYVESLPVHARRELEELSKPELESAYGLTPTISIEQRTASRNPRSTVGTMTEIYDFLRILYARLAQPYCPISGEPIEAQSRENIVLSLLEHAGETAILLTPLCRAKKGGLEPLFTELLQKGFSRIRVDGTFYPVDQAPTLNKKVGHDIDLVVDKVILSPSNKTRLTEAISLCIKMGNGMVLAQLATKEKELFFSTSGYSPAANRYYPPLEPHDFSFNAPQGACPTCAGLGVVKDYQVCPECQGERLHAYARAARFHGCTLGALCAMTLQEMRLFLSSLSLSAKEQAIGYQLFQEILQRLQFLDNVGLDYLSLNRTSTSLSGGEAQRVRLAAHIGSGLVGVTYVLDEPSIGLHPRDNHKLLATLQRLRDKGNSVLVVEHDEETIAAADHIIDVGPLAGTRGGEILVNGSLNDLLTHPSSLTGGYLTGKLKIPIPSKRRKAHGFLTLKGATHHNLRAVTLQLPLGCFTAVTGVSGSGKSSLISDTLFPALAHHLHKSCQPVGAFSSLEGLEQIDKVIEIDQNPIGRTPRSNPATYTGLFDEIRTLFAQLPESRSQGFAPGRFSFNVKEGCCQRCVGLGLVSMEMDFLETEWICCPLCQGKRFDEQTLSVSYKGKNIYDVLELEVDAAIAIFDAIPTIKKKLELFQRVGLGYIKLGQSATTLSGGEAQRIKLARELIRPATGKTLYILDEPTTGLHFHDINHLLHILQELVDKGNSVLVIEHNMDLVRAADWVIDMGPEGGASGGRIMATGTPETLAKSSTPTGIALAKALQQIPLRTKSTPTRPYAPITTLSIVGASQNNLKNISLEIPLGKMTVCTGPSGSGKSSFAFQTLYAEGQRRYTECLSPYVRQFVQQMDKPKVERVEGICPAIAIEQRGHLATPRSTVGTMTEIYDYLRLLYARLGIAHCPTTGEPIRSISKEYVCDRLFSYPEGTKIVVLAPLELKKQQTFADLVVSLQKQGYVRIKVNGTLYDLDQPLEEMGFDHKQQNQLFLVLDRLKIQENQRLRLLEALEQAAKVGQNKLTVEVNEQPLFFNLTFAVESTGQSYPPLTANSFAFNKAEGMCLQCLGLGTLKDEQPCPSCAGERLNPLARAVTLADLSLGALCALPIKEAFKKISSLPIPADSDTLADIKTQLLNRLQFLLDVGLGYLSINRKAPTLSGGEAQRIRLARQLGGGLTSILYVLDEPTIGLHPHDNEQLNKTLHKLKELGNTLVLVEHDPLTVRTADWVVEFGPGAGPYGGELIAQGTVEEILDNASSPTGAYMSGKKSLFFPSNRPKRLLANTEKLYIKKASLNNLHIRNLSIPLKSWCCLTGLSGSGKSTLMHDILAKGVHKGLATAEDQAAVEGGLLSGISQIERCYVLDQAPIGQTIRSDVGTYLDILPPIRTFFSQLPQARAHGLTPSHFSYNHTSGMCSTCKGLGFISVILQFLPSPKLSCPTCNGMRLNPISLSVSYKGYSFGELLQIPIDRLQPLFADHPAIRRSLQTVTQVGLAYLSLGRQMQSLSGGEAQRVKLCLELAKRSQGKTLYLLDEPTTGLHSADIALIIPLLHKLVEQGNSLLTIEHNVDFIKNSDWVIELGPGAGEQGGRVVAEGSPQELIKNSQSLTGRYLT